MADRVNTEALRALRIKDGHTLRSLSRLTNISVSYLSQIEAGLKTPRPGIAKRLAAALGVPLGSFFEIGDQSTAREYAGDFPAVVPDAS